MKHITLLVLIVIISSLKIFAQADQGRLDWIVLNCQREIQLYGYFQFAFKFSDAPERELEVEFVKKDVLKISNTAYRHKSPSVSLSFSDLYAVHFENNHLLVVDSLLMTNRVEHHISDFIKPFDSFELPDSIICCNSIMPILSNGTKIFIQKQYQSMWINAITFKIRTYTDEDALDFNIWIWKKAGMKEHGD